MRPELAQAIGLLRSNSPENIEKAIELLQDTVFSFSMKVCGHREDAEDTMQEVLYRSLRHLVRFEDPSAVAVWLYTVTRNRCWRMRRKTARAGKQVSLDELMPGQSELAPLLRDSAPGPEERAVKAAEQELLQKAVLLLPPQLRIVLVLHDMEELDTGELAQILGLKPGTVRVRLHRARLLMRREFSRLMQSAPRALKPAKKLMRRGKPAKRKLAVSTRSQQCRELFRNLSEYLDGRIEMPTCDRMREHIEACPACVAFIRDLQASIDRCRTMKASCPSSANLRLRALLAREYLRLVKTAGTKEASKFS